MTRPTGPVRVLFLGCGLATRMHSRTLMEWVLRIMANLLRPDEIGPAEAVYRMLAALVRVAPEP